MTYIERLGFGEINHTWEASVKKAAQKCMRYKDAWS